MTTRQFDVAIALMRRRERGEEITFDHVRDACDDDPVDVDVVCLLVLHMMPKPQYSEDGKTLRAGAVPVDVRDHKPFVCPDHMHDARRVYEELYGKKFKVVPVSEGVTYVDEAPV